MNEIHKLCECGCGNETTFNKNTKHQNKFLYGHNRRGLKLSFSESHKLAIAKGKTGTTRSKESILKMVQKNTGQTRSLNIRLNIANSKIGKMLSAEHKNAISKSHIGKKDTVETRYRKSLAIRKYRREHNNTGWIPNKGKYEQLVFNELQNQCQYSLLEDQQFLQYFPDRYIKELNLIIELYEPWHKNHQYNEYDLKRQLELQEQFHCDFYIIWLDEWNRNKDNITTQFKSLIEKLSNDKSRLSIDS